MFLLMRSLNMGVLTRISHISIHWLTCQSHTFITILGITNVKKCVRKKRKEKKEEKQIYSLIVESCLSTD